MQTIFYQSLLEILFGSSFVTDRSSTDTKFILTGAERPQTAFQNTEDDGKTTFFKRKEKYHRYDEERNALITKVYKKNPKRVIRLKKKETIGKSVFSNWQNGKRRIELSVFLETNLWKFKRLN